MKNQGIKFIHLRYQEDSDSEISKFSNTGGATIAYKCVKDKNNNLESIELGLSICSLNDNFSRYTGRHIATHRLLHKAPRWYLFTYIEKTKVTCSYELILDYALNKWPKELEDWKTFVEEKTIDQSEWIDNEKKNEKTMS